jgi:hypothetical protein
VTLLCLSIVPTIVYYIFLLVIEFNRELQQFAKLTRARLMW